MRPPKPRVRYKLSISLPAVKLEEHPGSSLRDPTATLVEIPAGSIVEAEGSVSESGLINVLWDSAAFSVFYDDLKEKARLLNSAEATG
ncbi:MAG TPA: hypothetical protein VKX49_24880 [Bryobacteraceae bacterium]|nr:hypothetical protein [Bryobacteraceae bacterium]